MYVVGQNEIQVKMGFLCLLTLIIHGSRIIRVGRQRKLRSKLGQNHFNLNFILTYNMYIMYYENGKIVLENVLKHEIIIVIPTGQVSVHDIPPFNAGKC